MVGDEASSCDGKKPSVKLELKEDCKEVNNSFDTGENGARMARENAEVINNYLSFTSCTVLSRTAVSEQTLAPSENC